MVRGNARDTAPTHYTGPQQDGYSIQRAVQEAETLYSAVLYLSREVRGGKLTETLSAMNNLAYVFKVQGRKEEAEPLYAECLTML